MTMVVIRACSVDIQSVTSEGKMKKEQFINLVEAMVQELEIERERDGYFKILGYERGEIQETPCFRAIHKYLSEEFDLNPNPTYGDDIDYFLYELDCGEKWKPGMITMGDVDIPMGTVEDLWRFVTNEYSV